MRSRYRPQAVLEGSGSFVRLDQEPAPLAAAEKPDSALHGDFLPDEVLNREGHAGWFAVVDSRGHCRWGMKEQEGWHLIILCARATPPEYLAYLRREAIPYLIAGGDHVDPVLALARLNEMLGIETVVAEAAGRLNGVLLRAGLIDELHVEFAPVLIGGTITPSLFDSPDLLPNELPTALELVSVRERPNGRLWVHYRVLREPGP